MNCFLYFSIFIPFFSFHFYFIYFLRCPPSQVWAGWSIPLVMGDISLMAYRAAIGCFYASSGKMVKKVKNWTHILSALSEIIFVLTLILFITIYLAKHLFVSFISKMHSFSYIVFPQKNQKTQLYRILREIVWEI